MNRIFFIALIAFFSACNANESSNSAAGKTDSLSNNVTPVMKGDIINIKWLEGNWKGMANDKPFYEHYQLKDSILSITTYDYDGKDTSNTDHSYVKWEKDTYYLGDSMNYKVIEMNENRIVMKANYHANNDILWAKKDPNSWDVVLTTKRGTTNYLMQRIAAVDSLIKRK